MKYVLMSIKKEWLEKIISGEKDIEVRKTFPAGFGAVSKFPHSDKVKCPVKVYFYETKSSGGSGTIVASADCYGGIVLSKEFLHVHLQDDETKASIAPFYGKVRFDSEEQLFTDFMKRAQITSEKLIEYSNAKNKKNADDLFGWELCRVKKENLSLSNFNVEKAPQSWQFVGPLNFNLERE